MTDRKVGGEIRTDFTISGAGSVQREIGAQQQAVHAAVAAQIADYENLRKAIADANKAHASAANAKVGTTRAEVGGDLGQFLGANDRLQRAQTAAKEAAASVAAATKAIVGGMSTTQREAMKAIDATASRLAASGMQKSRALAAAYAQQEDAAHTPALLQFPGQVASHVDAFHQDRQDQRRAAVGSEAVSGAMHARIEHERELEERAEASRVAEENVRRSRADRLQDDLTRKLEAELAKRVRLEEQAAARMAAIQQRLAGYAATAQVKMEREREQAATRAEAMKARIASTSASALIRYEKEQENILAAIERETARVATANVRQKARETAAAERSAARQAAAVAKQWASIWRSYRNGFDDVAKGMAGMERGVIRFTEVAYRSFMRAERAARRLARGVEHAAKATTRLAAKGIGVGVSLGSGFLRGSISAVRHFASELTHVISLLARVAAHKALQYGKRALVAYGAFEAAVTHEGFKSVSSSNNQTFEMGKEAQTAGLSTQRYQQYVNAAKASGVDEKDVLKAFGHLEEEVHKAAENPKSPQAQYLKELGVAILRKDSNGRTQFRSTDEIFRDVASRSANLSNDDKLAMMQALFGGKEALRIEPFLSAGGFGGTGAQTGSIANMSPAQLHQLPSVDAFTAGENRAKTLGTFITPEDEKVAARYHQSMLDLHDAMTGMRMEISRELSPAMIQFANVATGLSIHYRGAVAKFVSGHVKGLVRNTAVLAKIIDVETGLFSRIERARNGNHSSNFAPTMVKAYAFYLKNVRGYLVGVYHAMQTVGAAASTMLADAGLNSWDGFVGALGRVRKALMDTLATVQYYAREFWQAVVKGDTYAANDTPILKWLSEMRNKVVEYLGKVVEDIRKVWADGANSGEMQTYFGVMAQWIAWFAEQAPGWFTKIKSVFQGGVSFVTSLWSEFNKVLGQGPDARGQSSVFPFLNTLVGWFDTLKKRFEDAIAIVTTLFGWINKVFNLFGLDFGTSLLALSILRFTGLLGIMGGAWKLFAGVLEGVLATVGLISAALGSGGGFMAVVKALGGGALGALGIGGAAGAAGAAGLGAAEGAVAGAAGVGGMDAALAATTRVAGGFMVPRAAALGGPVGVAAAVGAGAMTFVSNDAIRLNQETRARLEYMRKQVPAENEEIVAKERARVREVVGGDIMNTPQTQAARESRVWAQSASAARRQHPEEPDAREDRPQRAASPRQPRRRPRQEDVAHARRHPVPSPGRSEDGAMSQYQSAPYHQRMLQIPMGDDARYGIGEEFEMENEHANKRTWLGKKLLFSTPYAKILKVTWTASTAAIQGEPAFDGVQQNMRVTLYCRKTTTASIAAGLLNVATYYPIVPGSPVVAALETSGVRVPVNVNYQANVVTLQGVQADNVTLRYRPVLDTVIEKWSGGGPALSGLQTWHAEFSEFQAKLGVQLP